MAVLQSLEELQNWDSYRDFLKMQLKMMSEESEPFYISKDKVDFEIKGKPWSGYALLVGKKAVVVVQNLRKEGVLFREGTCKKQDKTLMVEGVSAKRVKGAGLTLLKLMVGFKAEGGDEDGADDESSGSATSPTAAQTGAAPGAAAGAAAGDLARQAERIEKAVAVWRKTEKVATDELRKLQKAILAVKDPRATPVIKGLQGILTRLDKIDDEALEASSAAERGDAQGFAVARDDFRRKMQSILAYVEKDELIRDADSNPAVPIKIRDTLTNTLNKLLQAV